MFRGRESRRACGTRSCRVGFAKPYTTSILLVMFHAILQYDSRPCMRQGVWLVGGEQADADELVGQVPAAAAARPILIPQEPFARAYSAEMNVTDGSPSTGFAGAAGHPAPRMHVLDTGNLLG